MKHLLICPDDNLYDLCIPLIRSIRDNLSGEILIHLLTPNPQFKYEKQFPFVKEHDCSPFERLTRYANAQMRVEHLSYFCWARLFAPHIIEASHILYLDIDIIVAGNIDALFEIDMGDNLFVGKAEGKEVNTGVLLINREAYIREKVYEAINNLDDAAFIKDEQKFVRRYRDKTQLLPSAYNFNARLLKDYHSDDVRIIHFLGIIKAWTAFSGIRFSKPILDLYRSYGGKQLPMFHPLNRKALKIRIDKMRR